MCARVRVRACVCACVCDGGRDLCSDTTRFSSLVDRGFDTSAWMASSWRRVKTLRQLEVPWDLAMLQLHVKSACPVFACTRCISMLSAKDPVLPLVFLALGCESANSCFVVEPNVCGVDSSESEASLPPQSLALRSRSASSYSTAGGSSWFLSSPSICRFISASIAISCSLMSGPRDKSAGSLMTRRTWSRVGLTGEDATTHSARKAHDSSSSRRSCSPHGLHTDSSLEKEAPISVVGR